MTKQRQVILEELRKLTSHPTAAELYEIVREQLPTISLGTVYRNLELLSRNNIIQKLDIGGSEARFDGNPNRHHHVCCVYCGRVDDLHDLPTDLVRNKLRGPSGWKIVDYRLVFIGLCPKCRETHKKDM